MAQVKLTIKGADGQPIAISMDAKALPSFLASMSGKSAPVKSYIGKKEIANIKASSAEELVLKALELQDGIHVRFSGLNDAIRARFGKDPMEITGGLVTKGLIVVNPTSGGVRITKVVKANK